MENTLDNLLLYGYLFLFVYSLGGGIIGILGASILSALGKLDLTLSIVIASLGNFIGSTALAYLARYQKKELQSHLNRHKRKIALVYLWLKHYGKPLIFLTKYIYGFKTIVPLALGLSKASLKAFVILNFFASWLWGVSVGILGFLASDFVRQFIEDYKSYSYLPPLMLLTLLALIAAILYLKAKPKFNRF